MFFFIYSYTEVFFSYNNLGVIQFILGGTALLQLMEWLRVHFVKVDEWAAEATSERLPETSFQYWNAVIDI